MLCTDAVKEVAKLLLSDNTILYQTKQLKMCLWILKTIFWKKSASAEGLYYRLKSPQTLLKMLCSWQISILLMNIRSKKFFDLQEIDSKHNQRRNFVLPPIILNKEDLNGRTV